MKKLVLIVLVSLFFVGCGAGDRMVVWWTGNATMCVDGVDYIQFASGATVLYDRNGNVKSCD